MANQRDELTKATGITADVVMEVGAYFSAQCADWPRAYMRACLRR